MAEHKIAGSTMMMYIDPNGGTDYDMVVCLTSLNREDSVGEIDATSYCGPDSQPGAVTVGARTADGFVLADPTSGKLSAFDLRTLLHSRTTIGYKISPAVPQDGDEIESGTAYIQSLSDSYGVTDAGTFSLSIKPYGTPSFVIHTS